MNLAPLPKIHPFESRKITYPCYVQPKMDGINARYHKGKFYSSEGKIWNTDLVRPFLDSLAEFSSSDFTLLGEFWSPDLSLQDIVSGIAVSKVCPNILTGKIKFYTYDYYHPNKSILYEEIHQYIQCDLNIISPYVKSIETKLVHSEVEPLFKTYPRLNHDGVIIRTEDQIFKYKFREDSEFLCVGVKEGTFRLRGTLGSLICKGKNDSLFNVGSGFTDSKRRELYTNKPIGKQITVSYQKLTNNGVPFHPVFKGIRDYE